MRKVGFDKIILKRLQLALKIGTTPEERAFAQKVELDLELGIRGKDDWQGAGLHETVDWEAVKNLVSELAAEQEWVLAEHLAAAVCLRLFGEYSLVEEVKLQLRKYAVPGVACTAFEMIRERQDDSLGRRQ